MRNQTLPFRLFNYWWGITKIKNKIRSKVLKLYPPFFRNLQPTPRLLFVLAKILGKNRTTAIINAFHSSFEELRILCKWKCYGQEQKNVDICYSLLEAESQEHFFFANQIWALWLITNARTEINLILTDFLN